MQLLFTMLLHICASNIYAHPKPCICHIHKLIHMQIWCNYVRLYASCKLITINNVTRNTGIHFTISVYAPEQICLPQCIYMFHWVTSVVYLLNKHYWTYQLKSATLIYHTIAVPVTNVPLKYHIYATCPNYLRCINWGIRPIYTPDMNSLAPTM